MKAFLGYLIMASAGVCVLAAAEVAQSLGHYAGITTPAAIAADLAMKLLAFGILVGGTAITAGTIVQLSEDEPLRSAAADRLDVEVHSQA